PAAEGAAVLDCRRGLRRAGVRARQHRRGDPRRRQRQRAAQRAAGDRAPAQRAHRAEHLPGHHLRRRCRAARLRAAYLGTDLRHTDESRRLSRRSFRRRLRRLAGDHAGLRPGHRAGRHDAVGGRGATGTNGLARLRVGAGRDGGAGHALHRRPAVSAGHHHALAAGHLYRRDRLFRAAGRGGPVDQGRQQPLPRRHARSVRRAHPGRRHALLVGRSVQSRAAGAHRRTAVQSHVVGRRERGHARRCRGAVPAQSRRTEVASAQAAGRAADAAPAGHRRRAGVAQGATGRQPARPPAAIAHAVRVRRAERTAWRAVPDHAGAGSGQPVRRVPAVRPDLRHGDVSGDPPGAGQRARRLPVAAVHHHHLLRRRGGMARAKPALGRSQRRVPRAGLGAADRQAWRPAGGNRGLPAGRRRGRHRLAAEPRLYPPGAGPVHGDPRTAGDSVRAAGDTGRLPAGVVEQQIHRLPADHRLAGAQRDRLRPAALGTAPLQLRHHARRTVFGSQRLRPLPQGRAVVRLLLGRLRAGAAGAGRTVLGARHRPVVARTRARSTGTPARTDAGGPGAGPARVRHQRKLDLRVHYTLVNKHDTPISELYVNFTDGFSVKSLSFAPHDTVSADKALGFTIYKLKTPLAPGASMPFDFTLEYAPKGFANDASGTFLVHNGTFFNNRVMPQFGYQSQVQLTDRNDRRKYGLKLDVPRMPPLGDEKARANTYISNDADWISFDTTVSTAADQIALAPGMLQKEWTANGRRYFHYRMEQPMLNFFAYLSARYAVKQADHDGVAISVYYNPAHAWNVDRM